MYNKYKFILFFFQPLCYITFVSRKEYSGSVEFCCLISLWQELIVSILLQTGAVDECDGGPKLAEGSQAASDLTPVFCYCRIFSASLHDHPSSLEVFSPCSLREVNTTIFQRTVDQTFYRSSFVFEQTSTTPSLKEFATSFASSS